MINQIRLENYKCFKKLSLELSNLNVLAGINSMGKSSIIQVLLLLRQAYTNNSLDKGLHLNGDYIQLGTGFDVMNRMSEKDSFGFAIVSDNEESILKYIYEKESDYLKLDEINSLIKDTFVSGCNLFKNSFAYVSAARIGPQRYYEGSYYDVTEQNQVGIRGELFADYLAIKNDITIENAKVLHSSCKSKKLIDQVNAWLSEISPGISLTSDIDRKTGIVSLQYNLSKESYSPLNVGFGLSYVAPIVIALLKAKSDDLLIIENPEAHLHPKGQRKMGELISQAAAGGVQIIVETHSDHLLNGIRLSVKQKIIDRLKTRLNYFYRDEKEDNTFGKYYEYKKSSPQILDDGRLSDWPEGFFDEWDKALMDLF